VRWDDNGWPHALGGDLSKPLPVPKARGVTRTPFSLSDDFSADKFGTQWRFHKPAKDEMQRVRRADRALVVRGKGTGPADCSPMTFSAGDQAYEVSVALDAVDAVDAAQGGLLLFYSERMYYGVGFDGKRLITYGFGEKHGWLRIDFSAAVLHLRILNDRHIVTMFYGTDGERWTKHPWQFEVSGAHQNILGSFLSLRPALFSCGTGSVRFRDVRYRAIA
jgi:xylan 1,4-beta-xylosidase